MLSILLRGTLRARAASALVVLGLATSLTGFSVLLGQTVSTTATLDGDVDRAWDTPYDLLVRPAGSRSVLEKSDGLVRPNYVSAIHGGITDAQLAEIRAVDGVSVAAPLAAVGAVAWPSAVELPLPADGTRRAYRVRVEERGPVGARHDIETRYVAVDPHGVLDLGAGTMTGGRGAGTASCYYPVNCFAGSVCAEGDCRAGQFPSASEPRYYLPLLQPLQIAGVDPAAESRLLGLAGCMRSGRALADSDRLHDVEDPEPATVLPVLASTRSFVDEQFTVTVDTASLPADEQPQSATGWTPAGAHSASAEDLYASYLRTSVHDYVDPWPVWSAGDVGYTAASSGLLVADVVAADPSIWARANTFVEYGLDESVLVPPEATDDSYRSVVEHADVAPPGDGSSYRSKMWDVVGQYDPRCLRGFDDLAGGHLDAYSIPHVQLPDGRQLTPSRSLGSYVSSPPLLLTTLEGARWLSDPRRFAAQPGAAYISVVRVAVSGTTRPGEAAQRRLLQVASDIAGRTGLLVDVVKGSSTRDVRVELELGRPGLPTTVVEPWSAKGVAIGFHRQIRSQDLALLSAVLVVATILISQRAFLSMRLRRRAFGALRALGVGTGRLALAVCAETVMVSLASGLMAAVISSAWLRASGGRVVLALLAAPASVLLGLVGAVPALLSMTLGSPAAAIQGRPRVRASRPPAGPFTLGLRELATSWVPETAMAVVAAATAAAVGGVTVLIAASFGSRLDSTRLGLALGEQVRAFHVLVVLLTALVGGLATGQLLNLVWAQRRREFGVLLALGWSRRRLALVALAQTMTIAVVGAVVAGTVCVVVGAASGSARSATSLATGVAVGTSLLTCAVAATAAVLATRRSTALALVGKG